MHTGAIFNSANKSEGKGAVSINDVGKCKYHGAHEIGAFGVRIYRQ